MKDSDHLTAGELAAYLDHDVPSERRSRVESHLDSCNICRDELNQTADVADSWNPAADHVLGSRRSGRRLLFVGIPAALAAAAAIMLLPARDRRGDLAPLDTVRASEMSEGRTKIEIVSPLENATVSPEALTFRWRGSPASLYHLTILAEDGRPVFTADTQDTSFVLPDTVRLVAGSGYFWRVEGIGNGIISSTGATLMRINR